jgi:signal transduction histidine kinase
LTPAPAHAGRRYRSPLQRRIWALAALLATLPLLLLGLLEISLSYGENVERTAQAQRARVRAIAARIEERIGAIERAVRDSAAMPFADGLLTPQDRLFELHRLLKLVPQIRDLTVVDAGRSEALFASRIEADRLASGRSVDALIELPARAQVVYGAAQFVDGSDPVAMLAVPGFEPAAGWTLARVNLDVIREALAQPDRGSGEVYLIDRAGRVLAHPRPGQVLRQLVWSEEPMVREAARLIAPAQDDTVSFRTLDPLGRDAFVSVTTIAGPDWLLFVTEPAEVVFQSVRASSARLALMVLAAMLAAFVAARWLARRLSAPIVALAGQARRFGDGDLSVRAGLERGDEIGELGRAFDRMADELSTYTTNLESMVAEKTRDLQLANEHKSAFLANVSHELRTPLNAVIGFSEALEERLFGELNTKQSEYVGDIKASGLHLLALINDLLDLSKIESGRMELDAAPFEVVPLLESALALVRPRALRGGVNLHLEVGAPPAEFTGDARRIKQIVLNLLSNAVKFTRSGGDVRLSVEDSEAMLTITVEDTGLGIAEQDLQRIFEPFAQASTGEQRAEGTGLGLALTRRLVEVHGGHITVASRVGAGSRFVVHLPRLPAGAQQP